MSDWMIAKIVATGDGPRLGIKDLIDVEGTKTSAGSRLVLSKAQVAEQDAVLLEPARRQGARIVAKTGLTELAFGATGINPWFGTPSNPLNSKLIPGGSSSGSAVGLAVGGLDVAYGSDTGGSIRIPSACCGILGLKTSFGRIPLQGVWPLSPSLDTVGPMARDAAHLELGMQLLEPEFKAVQTPSARIAILGGTGESIVLDAIEKVLNLVASSVAQTQDPGLDEAWRAGMCIMFKEAYASNQNLLVESHRLDPAMTKRFQAALAFTDEDLTNARLEGEEFRYDLDQLLEINDFLALPTLRMPIPTFKDAYSAPLNANTLPFNLAGLPAVSVPVPLNSAMQRYLGANGYFSPMGAAENGLPIPLSIQLVGEFGSEDRLVGLAKNIEAACAQI